MKSCIGVFAILLIIGSAFAIQPVSNWTIGSTGHYTSAGTDNFTTTGGNVSNINLSTNMSTSKWTGFWGNVSGALLLSPGAGLGDLYSWTWSPANGGVVCAVAAPYGFNWVNVASVAASAIDSVWAFGNATDNTTNTLTDTCSIDIGGVAVAGTAANTTGLGAFKTCAVADSPTPTAKGDFAFCVGINSTGTLFNNQSGNYELIAPTNKTTGTTETYSFWMELG